ncbi:hypothetical protein MBBA_1816 [Methanoculleus bourgensis]|nr:hypothetical protein MBBA_1816 [Methanoculleus bourgensis]
MEDCKRRAYRGVPERGPADLHRELFVEVGDDIAELVDGVDLLPLDERCVAEDEPLVGPVSKPHQDQSFCAPLLEPRTGLLKGLAVIDARDDDRGGIDVDCAAEPVEDRKRGFRCRVVHPAPPQIGVGGEDGVGDLGETVLDEKISYVRVVEPFPAGVADMDRRFHTGEQFDQVAELRVAARVPAAADGDPVDVVGHHLEVAEYLVGNGPEVLEPRVLLPDAPGAVVTAFLEGEAVFATERGRPLDVFEVAVRTESPAVEAGPAPEIDGEMRHPAGTLCAPLL